MSHKGYSLAEKKKILNYILSKNEFYLLKGRKFWTDLADSGNTDRSWQSLKEVFLKRILPDLNNPYYRLSIENIRNIKNGVSSIDNSKDWVRRKNPARNSKTEIELQKRKEKDDSVSKSDTGSSILNELPTSRNLLSLRKSKSIPGPSKSDSPMPSKINKTKKLSTSPDISENELPGPSKKAKLATIKLSTTDNSECESPKPSKEATNKIKSEGEKSLISDSQNNNQSVKPVEDPKVLEAPQILQNTHFTMTLLSSDSEKSVQEIPHCSRKYEAETDIRKLMKAQNSKGKSLVKQIKDSRNHLLLNSVVGKVKIRRNHSGSDDSSNEHRENIIRHNTSTESVCSSSDTNYSEDSDHKSQQPIYVISKGKLYPLYRNTSTKVKQCYYECSNRKKYLPHKRLKSKHRHYDETLSEQKFCCGEVERAYYRRFYKYCAGGKVGRKPRPSDFMDLEKMFTLNHEDKCKFANIADEDMERDEDISDLKYLEQRTRDSTFKQRKSLLQMDFPNDKIEMCYLRDLEKYYTNGQIGYAPIKENYQRVLTEEERRHHKKYAHLYTKDDKVAEKRSIYIDDDDTSNSTPVQTKIKETSINNDTSTDAWKLKYLKEKKRSEELEKLLQCESSKNTSASVSPDINQLKREKPGPKCSKKSNSNVIIISDEVIPESKCPTTEKSSNLVVSDVIVDKPTSSKCDLKVHVSKHGEEVLENAFGLNTQQVDKFINFLKNVQKPEEDADDNSKKADKQVSTNVSDIDERKNDISDITAKENKIFEEIFAIEKSEEEVDLKRELFSSLELRMLLSDGNDEDVKKSPVTKTLESEKKFTNGVNDQSTPKTEINKKTNESPKSDDVKSNTSPTDRNKRRSNRNLKEPEAKRRHSERVETLRSNDVVADDNKKNEEKVQEVVVENTEIKRKKKSRKSKSALSQDEKKISGEDKRTTRSKGDKAVEEIFKKVALDSEPFFHNNVKFAFPNESPDEAEVLADEKKTRSSSRLTQSPKSTTSQKRYFECIQYERPSDESVGVVFNVASTSQQPSVIDTIDLDDTILFDENKMIHLTSHMKTDSIENLIIEEALRFPNKIPPSAVVDLEGQEKKSDSNNTEEAQKSDEIHFSNCSSIFNTQFIAKMGYLDSESSHSEEEESPNTNAILFSELYPQNITDLMSEESI